MLYFFIFSFFFFFKTDYEQTYPAVEGSHNKDFYSLSFPVGYRGDVTLGYKKL